MESNQYSAKDAQGVNMTNLSIEFTQDLIDFIESDLSSVGLKPKQINHYIHKLYDSLNVHLNESVSKSTSTNPRYGKLKATGKRYWFSVSTRSIDYASGQPFKYQTKNTTRLLTYINNKIPNNLYDVVKPGTNISGETSVISINPKYITIKSTSELAQEYTLQIESVRNEIEELNKNQVDHQLLQEKLAELQHLKTISEFSPDDQYKYDILVKTYTPKDGKIDDNLHQLIRSFVEEDGFGFSVDDQNDITKFLQEDLGYHRTPIRHENVNGYRNWLIHKSTKIDEMTKSNRIKICNDLLIISKFFFELTGEYGLYSMPKKSEKSERTYYHGTLTAQSISKEIRKIACGRGKSTPHAFDINGCAMAWRLSKIMQTLTVSEVVIQNIGDVIKKNPNVNIPIVAANYVVNNYFKNDNAAFSEIYQLVTDKSQYRTELRNDLLSSRDESQISNIHGSVDNYIKKLDKQIKTAINAIGFGAKASVQCWSNNETGEFEGTTLYDCFNKGRYIIKDNIQHESEAENFIKHPKVIKLIEEIECINKNILDEFSVGYTFPVDVKTENQKLMHLYTREESTLMTHVYNEIVRIHGADMVYARIHDCIITGADVRKTIEDAVYTWKPLTEWDLTVEGYEEFFNAPVTDDGFSHSHPVWNYYTFSKETWGDTDYMEHSTAAQEIKRQCQVHRARMFLLDKYSDENDTESFNFVSEMSEDQLLDNYSHYQYDIDDTDMSIYADDITDAISQYFNSIED